MTARYAKIVMTGCLAFFACLVALTNITDYGGNQPFVQHVLSMDTTFRDPDVAYRAITAPWLWTLGYLGIIAGEVLTAMLMAWATLRMFQARNTSAQSFNTAKSPVHLAALSGFLVWFLGFMAIGGEWFLMWQSAAWNGQEAAFRFYVSILLVLIYVSQPDGETDGRTCNPGSRGLSRMVDHRFMQLPTLILSRASLAKFLLSASPVSRRPGKRS